MDIQVNVYLEGKVKSLGSEFEGRRFTAGIMLPGRYTFKTDSEETITVTVGGFEVMLPDNKGKKVSQGETIVIPPGVEFGLAVEEACSYICFYK